MQNSSHTVGFGIFDVRFPTGCPSGGSIAEETPALIVAHPGKSDPRLTNKMNSELAVTVRREAMKTSA